jgi:hypothetical protein
LALGLGWLAAWLIARTDRRIAEAGVLVLLAALTLYRGATAYPRSDSRDRADDTGLEPGWAILADRPPEGTAVLGTLPESLALDYLAQVWRARPDLHPVTAAEARAALSAGSPLAVTQAALPLVPAEVSPEARHSALGRTLATTTAEPGRAPGWDPAAGQALDWVHDFDGELRLDGGQWRSEQGTLLLAWQALNPTQDWSVSVRLTQGGQEIAQTDSAHPVWGAYPTRRWSPGEVVGDAYAFPADAAAAADGARVILYRRLEDGTFENLDVAEFALPSLDIGR